MGRRPRFLDELLASERKALLLFPVTVFLIAPLTHELFHIAAVMLYNCPFDISIMTGAELIFGIKPLCQLNQFQTVILLSSGIAGNVALGILIFLIAAEERVIADSKRKYVRSFDLSVISLGFLFSPAIYFFQSQGDIVQLLQLFEISMPYIVRIGIGVFLLLLAALRFWIDFQSIEKEYTIMHFLQSCRTMVNSRLEHVQFPYTIHRFSNETSESSD